MNNNDLSNINILFKILINNNYNKNYKINFIKKVLTSIDLRIIQYSNPECLTALQDMRYKFDMFNKNEISFKKLKNGLLQLQSNFKY